MAVARRGKFVALCLNESGSCEGLIHTKQVQGAKALHLSLTEKKVKIPKLTKALSPCSSILALALLFFRLFLTVKTDDNTLLVSLTPSQFSPVVLLNQFYT